MYNNKDIKIRTEQVWRLYSRAALKFGITTEPRVKIIRIGKIEGQELEGVEFRFTDKQENNFMSKEEFFENFEKIY